MTSRPIPDDLLPWALEQLGLSVAANAAVTQPETSEEQGNPQGTAAAPESPSFKIIAGDASNRRYFRLAVGGDRYVVAEAPPSTEKNVEFVAVQRLLAGSGVRVPKLLAADTDRGYLLLEDLGDAMLLSALDDASVDGHYGRAFGILRTMADIEVDESAMPAYDRPLLEEELSRFDIWFVKAMLGYSPGEDERAMIAAFGERLIQNVLEQPRVLVHRDFHSRNLMLLPGDELALIDFQDAVVGPVTYDLVSLLKDCYIRWPEAQVRGWALDYRASIPVQPTTMAATGNDSVARSGQRISGEVDDSTFLRWFDLTGLERHIKVLGTFARLHLRDGKAGYLDDLPLVIDYVEETLARYGKAEPELAAFAGWFEEKLKPLIVEQAWSKSS